MWNYGRVKETLVNLHYSLSCLLDIIYQGMGCKGMFIHDSVHVDRILNVDYETSNVMKHI